jgi:hypothetical protein
MQVPRTYLRALITLDRNNRSPMPRELLPVATCPGCKIQMRVKSRQPLKSSTCLDEVSYECPQCGTETKRAVSSKLSVRQTSAKGRAQS